MKTILKSLAYLLISGITIIVIMLIINNIKPTNHTHDKELEKQLIDVTWKAKKYYNDELKDIIIRFNSDHTLDFYYKENKRPVDLYYNNCNIWKWTEQNRNILIECQNTSYSKSYIEIDSITDKNLRIKLYNETLELKKDN